MQSADTPQTSATQSSTISLQTTSHTSATQQTEDLQSQGETTVSTTKHKVGLFDRFDREGNPYKYVDLERNERMKRELRGRKRQGGGEEGNN